MGVLLLALVLNAKLHADKIKDGQEINYNMENMFSAIAILIAVLLDFAFFQSFRLAAAELVLAPALRWILHDLCMNYFRELPWDYMGVRSVHDNFLRRFNHDYRIHPIMVKLFFLWISVAVVWWGLY